MTKTLSAATFALALTVPAMAFALDADTDGDGMVSMEEFQAAMPEAPAGTFEQLDSDADGMLSEDEIAAGQEAGILPA
ncbi:EF-hand domain-containing protein [Roseovarius sp. SK2]|jgi:Ca2+-binding EF-hand superfamily protein|uniref:calcium-binding protein n=1 Tax=Roseovarius TaxID=74030 RepID=UPI000CDDAD1D|nr:MULTISPECIES: calcium-binding protein [Roseovarius]MDD9726653.1 EF-hand domain-containing protein [Roseovarius sp. SK2]